MMTQGLDHGLHRQLKDAVYLQLRDDIISGALPAGAVLREVELVAKLIVGQTGNGVGGPRLALTMNAQKPDVGTLWRVECVAQSHTTDRRARCAVPQEKAAELMLVPTALSERLR